VTAHVDVGNEHRASDHASRRSAST
jgi:hypothetical protein